MVITMPAVNAHLDEIGQLISEARNNADRIVSIIITAAWQINIFQVLYFEVIF